MGILTKRQSHRPAVGRIRHHPQGTRQGSQDMFGPRNPVEIAADRAEAIIGADRRIVKILDLLQHRIGRAAGKNIARDQQDRHPVHMRQSRRRHHIQRPRPDRGGDSHRPPPLHRLGIGNRGMGHRLLVLAAPGRQSLANPMQRLPQTRHVAMAENRPDTRDKPLAVFGHLHRKPFHHRLRGGQSHGRLADRCHAGSPMPLRASSQ